MAPAQDSATSPAPPGVTPDEIERLRQEYPGFRIWREAIGDRVRYVARRLRPGTGPHTVVTADLDELRAVLADATTQPRAAGSQAFDTSAPNAARMYAHWLGG